MPGNETELEPRQADDSATKSPIPSGITLSVDRNTIELLDTEFVC